MSLPKDYYTHKSSSRQSESVGLVVCAFSKAIYQSNKMSNESRPTMTPVTGLGDIGVTLSEVKKVMQVKQAGKVKKLKRVPCLRHGSKDRSRSRRGDPVGS